MEEVKCNHTTETNEGNLHVPRQINAFEHGSRTASEWKRQSVAKQYMQYVKIAINISEKAQ